jgi:hypothetical protein
MVCPRCEGLMLQEVFVDFIGTDGSFEGWHCPVCGEIVDPVIASNRVLLMSGALGQAVHGAGGPISRTAQRVARGEGDSYFCETPSCAMDDAQGGQARRLRMRTLTVKR